VPGTGDVDHVEIVFLDQPVEVNVDEIQTGCGSPVPEQPRLDVFLTKRLLKQRIVVKIDLTDRQVVGRAPVSIALCWTEYSPSSFLDSVSLNASSGGMVVRISGGRR
jgi:hypothetical protein